MPRDLSAEETVVIATYANRPDAEVDKARLDDQDVSSVVGADDVHTPLPLTEGVELRVLSREADRAREILETGRATHGRVARRTPVTRTDRSPSGPSLRSLISTSSVPPIVSGPTSVTEKRP